MHILYERGTALNQSWCCLCPLERNWPRSKFRGNLWRGNETGGIDREMEIWIEVKKMNYVFCVTEKLFGAVSIYCKIKYTLIPLRKTVKIIQ